MKPAWDMKLVTIFCYHSQYFAIFVTARGQMYTTTLKSYEWSHMYAVKIA